MDVLPSKTIRTVTSTNQEEPHSRRMDPSSNQPTAGTVDRRAENAVKESKKLVVGVGTIGITGVMCPEFKSLFSAWLLLTSCDDDTGKVIVRCPSNILMKELVSEVVGGASTGVACEATANLEAVGDLLEELDLSDTELFSINDVPCRGLPLEQVQEQLILLGGYFTLVFQRLDQDPWTKRLILLKPFMTDAPKGQSFASPPVELRVTIPFKTSPIDGLPRRSTKEKLGEVKLGNELCIGSISSSDQERNWRNLSPLSEDDRVLSVNEKDFVRELSASDAEILVNSMYECSPSYLSILVNTPPHKRKLERHSWRDSFRKGAVAVGGGAMLGAGAVLMATPLHPLGHAMAIGGVGVLGTEYEQPKRMATQASSRLSDLAGRFRQSFHKQRQQDSSIDHRVDNGEDDASSSSFASFSEDIGGQK